jgi:hypothetical protein
MRIANIRTGQDLAKWRILSCGPDEAVRPEKWKRKLIEKTQPLPLESLQMRATAGEAILDDNETLANYGSNYGARLQGAI